MINEMPACSPCGINVEVTGSTERITRMRPITASTMQMVESNLVFFLGEQRAAYQGDGASLGSHFGTGGTRRQGESTFQCP